MSSLSMNQDRSAQLKPIKIFTDGARCEMCQLPRIERGFLKLGSIVTDKIEEADLIYSNNPWYDSIISEKANGRIKGKVIFNILDLAPHLGRNFPLERLREGLKAADAVTCISETVKKDCEERLGISPTVIYNPIMDVWKEKPSTQNARKYRFLLSGRLLDPNKRVGLALDVFRALNVNSDEVAVCGPEYPGFGVPLGLVSPDELRKLYNEVDFVMMTSKHEGLGLQVPEAMAAGSIPIVCNDLSTIQEFLPFQLFREYEDVYPNTVSIVRFLYRLLNDDEERLNLKNRLYFYYENKLKNKFTDIGVAKAILGVYYQLA